MLNFGPTRPLNQVFRDDPRAFIQMRTPCPWHPLHTLQDVFLDQDGTPMLRAKGCLCERKVEFDELPALERSLETTLDAVRKAQVTRPLRSP